jgi:hypothetical protein
LAAKTTDTARIDRSIKPVAAAKIEKIHHTTSLPPKPSSTITTKMKQDEIMEDDNTVEWVPPKNQSGSVIITIHMYFKISDIYSR